MKSIKSTFIRGLALMLALIFVFNVPVAAFATTEIPETYAASSAVSYNTQAEMIAHSAYQALKYLGYDKDEYLETNGYLFTDGYMAGSLKNKMDKGLIPDCLTDVPYCTDGAGSGRQTTTTKPNGVTVTSVTGKYPALKTFEQTGLDCVDFAAYYLTNYLPNIEGADITWLDNILAKYADDGYVYDDMYFWPEARNDLARAGVKVWTVKEVDYTNGNISKYTDPNGTVTSNSTSDIYASLQPGTLIQMGNESSKTVHYAIYLGTYDGQHIIVHSGSSKRGPEVSVVENMADESNGDKRSVPLYFYEFPHVNQYGEVTVQKSGPNGEKLTGAEFKLTNTDTGEFWKLTTNNTGTATKDGLALGNYTIQETAAPAGYVLDSKVYSFELTSAESHYVHAATNTLAKGSIVAVKYKDDGNTWLAGAVFACKTSGKNEYVYIYDADSGSVTFTDPTSGKTVTAYADGNGNGVVTFSNLPLGSYLIYEAKAPNGYVRTSLIDTVVLSANGQTERIYKPTDGNYTDAYLDANGKPYDLFTNKLAVGSITAVKYKDDGNTWLAGAVFACKTSGKNEYVYIYDADSGSVTFTDPTSGKTVTAYADGNGNGVVTFSNLPLGSYLIYEAKAPNGYIRTSLIDTVVLSADGQAERIYKPTDGNYTDAYLDANGDPYALFTNKLAVGTVIVGKYNADASAYVPGAVFGCKTAGKDEYIYVYDADSGSITFTDPTNGRTVTAYADGYANGVVTFKGLPLGSYLIYEAMAPAGYNRTSLVETVVLSADGQSERIYKPADGNYTDAYLNANGEPYDLFKNTLSVGSIIVQKRDKDDVNLKLVPGAVFGCYSASGEVYYRYDAAAGETITFIDPYTGKEVTCTGDGAANGGITFSNLVYGKYVIRELVAPEGYELGEGDGITVTLDSNSPSHISYYDFLNEPYKGDMEIIKDVTPSTSATPENLAGWAFNLYVNDSVFSGTYNQNGLYRVKVTDCDGNVTFYDETSAEMDTFVDGSTIHLSLAVSGDGLIYQWEISTDGGTTWNNAAVPFGGPYVSDETGRINVKALPLGSYYVVELPSEREGWICDNTPRLVEIQRNVTASVTFTNTLLGKGQIRKDTTNGGDKSGWLFEVRDAEGNVIEGSPFISDAEGDIDLGLLVPGIYTVTEIGREKDTGDYWVMDSEAKTLEVIAGETASVTFTNQLLGNLAIRKEMTDGGSLEGWTFVIRDKAGKEIEGSPFVTDEEGRIFTGLLEPGVYTVEEIIPEDSLYQCVGENPKTVEIAAGQTAAVTFTNALRPGSITVNKINGATGEPLAGAVFLLEWLDGETWTPVVYSEAIIPGGCNNAELVDGCLTSGEDGILTFEGLNPVCPYRLTEVKAPNGYMLQAGVCFEGKLPVGDSAVSLTVENSPTYVYPPSGSMGIPGLHDFAVNGLLLTLIALIAACPVLLIIRRREIKFSADNSGENKTTKEN